MSSPFQKAFSAKSPLHNHGDKFLERAKNLSKKDGEDGDFNYENDKVMKLKAKGELKNAEHDNSQNDIPSTAEEQQSVANMNYEADDSMINMNSPLDAAASAGRSGHPTHMQAGNDNSGNPNAASSSEYWRVHQQTSHHKKPKSKIDKKIDS
jgi:hypothetical protein